MADKKNPTPAEGDEPEVVVPAADELLAEGFEDADVETSFSDDDLAFLAGKSEAGQPVVQVDPAVELLGDLKRVQA